MDKRNADGFTLIEILVVIGMIAILATVVLIAINPSRQFAQGRNSQRVSNVSAILNAIGQNIADHKGSFNCVAVIPTSTAAVIKKDGADIRTCLVPNYISELPVDPQKGTVFANDSYDTGYTVIQDNSSGRITISAPGAELGESVSITR